MRNLSLGISNCPVLEDLVVETCHNDNVATFTINVPSIQSLSIRKLQYFGTDDDVFAVQYHSLKQLTIVEYYDEIDFIGNNMPKLVEANLRLLSCHAKVLASFPNVKCLSLCLGGENHLLTGDRKVFWIQPSCVPECFLFHLKNFEWRDYDGSEEEKEVAIYILKMARRLMTATIYPDSLEPANKHQMFEVLEIESRGSRVCELTMR